jgi:xanthine/uracil permease
LKILVEHKIDFDNKKNLLIASVILVSGIGGLMIDLGGLQITGVASSTILGILLYQILPDPKKGSKELVNQLKRKNYGDCRWESVTETFGDNGNPHE